MTNQTTIELTNLTYTYTNMSSAALDKLSFTLTAGSWQWILGPSGAGKSTLIQLLAGMQHLWTNGKLEGSFRFNGQEVTKETWRSLRGQIGAVFEDADSGLVLEIVEDELAFAPENLGLSVSVIDERIQQAAKQMDIERLLPCKIETLSGGQKQRTVIASMLTMQPVVWLLDDATANLDANAVHNLMTLLRKLQQQGHIILFCSSRLHAYHATDQVLLLAKGQSMMQFQGVQIADSLSCRSAMVELGCIPDVTEVIKVSMQTQHHEAKQEQSKMQLPYILQAKKLNFHYGDHQVLDEIDVSLTNGEILMVTGENGSGKTTFGKLLAGLLPCQKGMLYLNGQDITALSDSFRAQQIGYGFQQPEHQFIAPTVIEECVYGLLIQQGDELPRAGVNALPQPVHEKGMEMLARFAIADKHLLDPFQLSASDKRRLALATLLITQPKLLVLDEPTAGLDYRSTEQLLTAVQSHVRQYHSAAVIITHDVPIVSKIATNELRLA